MKNNIIQSLKDKKMNSYKNDKIVPLNTTIEPTPFPYHLYQEVEKKQLIMNQLIYKMMINPAYDDVNDPFLYELNKIKQSKPPKKTIGLFIRTDYLLDSDNIMKQVEINTISLAFLFWGPMLNKIHAQENKNTLISQSDEEFLRFIVEIKNDFEGESVAIMVDGDTGPTCSNNNEKQEIIRRLKQLEIDMHHLTFADVIQKCKFYDKDKNEVHDDHIIDIFESQTKLDTEYEMYYNGKKVFFVYYRWFYNENQYLPSDYVLRSKIECSSAFSLPSVELQMAGHKAYQVKLTDKNYLGKYLNQSEIDTIYQHFGNFKNTDELTDGDENSYILKSYGEGGGNNIFGRDMYKFDGDKNSVFLMKKISPQSAKNKFNSSDTEIDVIPEIGVMGWLIARNNEIQYNNQAGYICRSKNVNSNECGVSCGFGALDSIKKE